jgi:hypothetical protein
MIKIKDKTIEICLNINKRSPVWTEDDDFLLGWLVGGNDTMETMMLELGKPKEAIIKRAMEGGLWEN